MPGAPPTLGLVGFTQEAVPGEQAGQVGLGMRGEAHVGQAWSPRILRAGDHAADQFVVYGPDKKRLHGDR